MAEYLLTPGPVPLHEETIKAMARQVVSHRSQVFRSLLRSVREKLVEVYGGGEPLVLTGSGTLAVESMAWSLVEPGDRVLVVSHGEFGERLREALERRGAAVDVLRPPRPGEPVPPEAVEARLEGSGYQAVALVYTETSLGLSYHDAARIAEKAHEAGALVLVDAVSALGGEPVPPPGRVDAVATASQKALAGPPGLSFVALSSQGVERVEALRVRPPSYLDLGKALRFHRERSETPYTPAVNLLYAMERALELLLEAGPEEWRRRHCRRARLLYEKLPALGLEPVVAERGYRSCTVAGFRTPVPSSRVAEALLRHGYRVARGMGGLREAMIRISTMGWLPDEAYRGLVEALEAEMPRLLASAR